MIGKSGYSKAVLCIRAISPIFCSNDLDALDEPACLGRVILNLMPMGYPLIAPHKFVEPRSSGSGGRIPLPDGRGSKGRRGHVDALSPNIPTNC